MRSARANISQASDHIQSRATSRAMMHSLQLRRGYVWIGNLKFNADDYCRPASR
jgi:hypothetical protein